MYISKYLFRKIMLLFSVLLFFFIIGEGNSENEKTRKLVRGLPLTEKTVPEPGNNSFIYYASDYHQHEIYLSPDVPTMVAFGQNNRLSRNEPQPKVRLVLDLPEGCQVWGGRFITRPVEETRLRINNLDYRRFRISIPYFESRPGVTEIIITTTIKSPVETMAYYATEIDNRLLHQREIPLHIIHIPYVGSPKRLYTAFFSLGGVLDDYPDTNAFTKIGFSQPDAQCFEREIKSGAYAKAAVNFLRFSIGEEDSYCVRINGEKIRKGLSCPTYLGGNYKAVLERGKRAIDLGVYSHWFDPERGDGKEICFCPRCLSQFQEYFHSHSTIEYKDPREFMQNPNKYPEYNRQWLQFKLEKENDRYQEYKNTMKNYMKTKGLNPDLFTMALFANFGCESHWKDPRRWSEMIERTLQDPLILKDIFDYYCPMIYVTNRNFYYGQADLIEVSEEIKGILDYSRGSIRVYPALTAGWPYSQSAGNIEPNGMMKYQILEALAAGAKGFVIYSEGWFDALDMKYVAEAMKQVLPVEDVIFEGTPIPEGKLTDINRSVFVKGVQCEKGAVVLVSEYSFQPKEAKIRYETKEKLKVIDLSTYRQIGELTPDEPVFSVNLDEDRARLFFIGKNAPGVS